MRLLQNRAASITFTVTDQDGTAVDATGTPTVVVRDGAGATVASGNATNPGGTGTYGFDLTAAQLAVLDDYTATLTYVRGGQAESIVTTFEVVGGFYFTLAEARAFDNSALSDTSRYTTASILETREEVEDQIENVCGVAFVRRGVRLRFSGESQTDLFLPIVRPYAVTSASIDGTALTASEIADVVLRDYGVLYREAAWTSGTDNVVLHLAHGYSSPPPPIKRAALTLLKHRLAGSDIDDRAISFTDELGTRQLAVAGRKGQPTGIPDVDAVLAQYSERVPVLG